MTTTPTPSPIGDSLLRALPDQWRKEADLIQRNQWACTPNSIRARADELDAILAQHPQSVGAPVSPEPNGEIVGWWNGIRPDGTDRSPYGPSVRWGADKEDRAHKHPLYDGYNPIHYKTPDPRERNEGGGEAVAKAISLNGLARDGHSDWLWLAKLTNQYGIRYKTNASMVCFLRAIVAELGESPAPTASDPWREAVLDELIVSHIYRTEHDNNPKLAIQDAINWNCKVALDPEVSSDAQALVALGALQSGSGLREALDLLDILFTAYEEGTPCYEDPEEHAGYLGNAFVLDEDTAARCADLLNRERPRATPPAPDAAGRATPPPAAPEQASTNGLAREEAAHLHTIDQRDHAHEVIDRLCDAVLGNDRHEWSSAYGFAAAVTEVEDRMAELTKAPTVVAQPWAPVTDVEVEAMCDAFEATHGTGAQAMAAAGNTIIALRVPPQTQGVVVDDAMARQLDDYLEAEFDIRIGKQSARAALEAALAPQQTEGGQ